MINSEMNNKNKKMLIRNVAGDEIELSSYLMEIENINDARGIKQYIYRNRLLVSSQIHHLLLIDNETGNIIPSSTAIDDIPNNTTIIVENIMHPLLDEVSNFLDSTRRLIYFISISQKVDYTELFYRHYYDIKNMVTNKMKKIKDWESSDSEELELLNSSLRVSRNVLECACDVNKKTHYQLVDLYDGIYDTLTMSHLPLVMRIIDEIAKRI